MKPRTNAHALQNRRQTACEEVCVDERNELVVAQPERGSDDERHRDRTGVHHEHVLRAEGQQMDRSRHLIDRMHASQSK
jgi:hypothetical protein